MCIADVMLSGFSQNFTQAVFLMCTLLVLHLVDPIDSLEWQQFTLAKEQVQLCVDLNVYVIEGSVCM